MITTQTYKIGDCLELMKEIPDKSIDLVITDPPYGISIGKMNFTQSGAIKVGGAYRNDYSHLNLKWDDNRLSYDILKELFRTSNNQIIFGGNYIADMLPPSKCWVVWDKRVDDKYSNDFADCELIWTSFNKPSKMIRFLWSGMLQNDMSHKEERVHPTQKPIDVIKIIINRFSKEGETILDPFLGSGTTLRACRETNRNGIGFEINPDYEPIIRKRLMADIPSLEVFA